MKKEKIKEFLAYTDAIIDSMKAILLTENSQNVWRFSNYYVYMRKYNELLEQIAKHIKIETILDYFDLKKVKSPFDTLPDHQKNYFSTVHANLLILKSFLENKLDLKKDEIFGLTFFLQANLRKAIFEIPKKEKDIQNTVEQLLIGKGLNKGIDYDRETGRIKVSIKESIPDFIFLKLDLALELKFSTTKNKSKTIVDEINADIQVYSKKYQNILFLVYDLGSIRDENEFKNGIENKTNINVIIVKH